MKFIDLAAQQKLVKEQIDANIQTVLSHGNYIMGPEVKELEDKLAAYCGAKHAVGCASGTDALLMALMANNVKPGDAIFTTTFTFIATAEIISLLGATPVFVDIDPGTFNIDPNKLELAINALKTGGYATQHPEPGTRPLTPGTRQPTPGARHPLPLNPHPAGSLNLRGIIAVDLFGLPADYDSINKIADKHNLFVIEDAAQSFGAQLNNKKACNLADIACTSFFPAKPLGCYGDGGMCFTNDDRLANTMQSLRVHGKGNHKYDNTRIGINGRLDTIQAAILLAKFNIFPKEIRMRQQAARLYTDLLSPPISSEAGLTPPTVPKALQSAWAQYSLLARNEDHRSGLQQKLKEQDIPTAIYYPKPLHLQIAFNYLGYQEGDFPISEDCSKRIFSIPMHPYLSIEDQKKIAETISKYGPQTQRD